MDSHQPLLPVRECPRSLEYNPAADDGPGWIIGDWRAIAEGFGLQEHEVKDWHAVLAGQGRPWLVIRRIHAIAPEWGPGLTPEDMQKWSWPSLATALGLPEAVLRRDLEAAVEFWKKARLSLNVHRSVQAAAVPGEVKPLDLAPARPLDSALIAPAAPRPGGESLPDFQIHQDFNDAQITAILTPFRFNHLRQEEDRLYVANRILELRSLLEDKLKRESARMLILMEMNTSNYEATIAALKSRLFTIQKSKDIDDKQSKEIQSIGDAIEKAEKALTKLSTTYQTLANDLGGDQMEQNEARRIALGTASHLIEAHRKYYETGERLLIDGMFTAEEIVWLTTPLTIRPAQYRPDIVLRVREACLPENLWSADYKPTVIQREACRRLLKLAQAMSEEIEPPVIDGIDDAPTNAATDDDDPADASAAIMPQRDAAAPAEYLTPASPKAEEPFMAIG